MRKFEIISKKEFEKKVDGKFYENIKIPERSTKNSAGYDFYLPYDVVIPKGKTVVLSTGIKACMNNDEFLMVVIRSSLGVKKGLKMANQVGIIDSDYYNNIDNEGHVWICLQNEGNKDYIINVGDSFAQGIFTKYLLADDDNSSGVRVGGLGSTNRSDNNE